MSALPSELAEAVNGSLLVAIGLAASMCKVAFAAESERYDRPGDILGGINRALTGKCERAYITACCGVIDQARRTIRRVRDGGGPVPRGHSAAVRRCSAGGGGASRLGECS